MAARRRAPLAKELPAELQVAATNSSILSDSRGRKYIDFGTPSVDDLLPRDRRTCTSGCARSS